jgi:4-azaleucine resistance transporter AzlC
MPSSKLIDSLGTNGVTFTHDGIFTGVRRALPLALSVFTYGSVFGVLARQTGLSAGEALCMSGLVFAGSAQLIVLDLWQASLPVAAIILTTLVVNLRHALMGAALQPWFRGLSRLQKYGSAFFMADENWGLSIGEFKSGYRDAALLLGSGLLLYLSWFSATGVGYVMGAVVQDPASWGLDFAFLAVFLALLAGMWQGKSDLLPWAIAALVAIAGAKWLPGEWYILLGGLAGSAVGAIRDEN